MSLQEGCRHCFRCAGFFLEGGNSICPNGRGPHVGESIEYFIIAQDGGDPLFIPEFGGQTGWAFCISCGVLFFAENTSSGHCPVGGGHIRAVSRPDLRVLFRDSKSPTGNPEFPSSGTEDNWFWCHRCQGMFHFDGIWSGWCPAGGGHDRAGSGAYIMWVVPTFVRAEAVREGDDGASLAEDR
jgi:hypothetical protein